MQDATNHGIGGGYEEEAQQHHHNLQRPFSLHGALLLKLKYATEDSTGDGHSNQVLKF
jgi:hypothetical protein